MLVVTMLYRSSATAPGGVPPYLYRALALAAARAALFRSPSRGGAALVPLGPRGARVWAAHGRDREHGPAPARNKPLRILTYNVEGGNVVSFRLREILADTRPDIAGFQECGLGMHAVLAALKAGR